MTKSTKIVLGVVSGKNSEVGKLSDAIHASLVAKKLRLGGIDDLERAAIERMKKKEGK